MITDKIYRFLSLFFLFSFSLFDIELSQCLCWAVSLTIFLNDKEQTLILIFSCSFLSACLFLLLFNDNNNFKTVCHVFSCLSIFLSFWIVCHLLLSISLSFSLSVYLSVYLFHLFEWLSLTPHRCSPDEFRSWFWQKRFNPSKHVFQNEVNKHIWQNDSQIDKHNLQLANEWFSDGSFFFPQQTNIIEQWITN